MSDLNPFVFVLGVFFVLLVARSIVIIKENHRGAVVRLGRYLKTLGPGLAIRVPFVDLVTKVDLDSSIPGWQGMSEKELDAAVESFATFGTARPAKAAPARAASAPRSASPPRDVQGLTDWLLKAASDQTGVDLAKDALATKRIAESATAAAEALRSAESFEINLPFITADASGPKHFAVSVTREQLG